MPIPSSSELPKPKSWDEFEDIVWELYTREWKDNRAQRYGRQGQPQNGVDIYGNPKKLKKYEAIQCKRYTEKQLSKSIISASLKEAERFSSPIEQYIIATTESRNAKLQDFIRELNKNKINSNIISVSIVFWEDICAKLTHPSNSDLLRKYYSEWSNVFQPKKDHSNKRKEWRRLEFTSVVLPKWENIKASRSLFLAILSLSLKKTFDAVEYTEFVSLISESTKKIESCDFLEYKIFTHKIDFCHCIQQEFDHYIRKIRDEYQNIEELDFSKGEKEILKEDIWSAYFLDQSHEVQGWILDTSALFQDTFTSHLFIVDSKMQKISFKHLSLWDIGDTRKIKSKGLSTTSDLMLILSRVLNEHLIWGNDLSPLLKKSDLSNLLNNIYDGVNIKFVDDFRINVNDDEEWKYVGNSFDV